MPCHLERLLHPLAAADVRDDEGVLAPHFRMSSIHLALDRSCHCRRLRVDAESVSTKRELEPWVMQSVAFARSLPPKKK